MAMEYRHLGRLGVRVSPLCLGTMNFGWKQQEQQAFEIMDAALEHGINFYDTANVYGGWDEGRRGEGVTEQIVGRWFAQGDRRREPLAVFLLEPLHPLQRLVEALDVGFPERRTAGRGAWPCPRRPERRSAAGRRTPPAARRAPPRASPCLRGAG